MIGFWCEDCGDRFYMEMAEATKETMTIKEAERLSLCPKCARKQARQKKKESLCIVQGKEKEATVRE